MMKGKKKDEMEEKVTIDSASKICARTFEAIAIAGIVFLIIGLILYACNIIPPFVPMEVMEKLWHLKPSVFWSQISKELHVTLRLGSYSWIFDNISHSDMVAMVGVLIFIVGVIATIIGICAAYAKYDRKALIISIILLIITLYAILEYV